MVRIFRDSHGAFAVQTTCLDVDAFMADLSDALATIAGDGSETIFSVLQQAMPIAFKLSGYKADSVIEQRTLLCGVLSPRDSEQLAVAGK